MKVKGQVVPLGDKILISNMEFGMEKSQGGIVLHSDNGKNHGIKPRWGRVFAVGKDQHDVTVGQWICIEHGRWTRTWDYENEDGTITELRGVDNKAILLVADEKPEGAQKQPSAF